MNQKIELDKQFWQETFLKYLLNSTIRYGIIIYNRTTHNFELIKKAMIPFTKKWRIEIDDGNQGIKTSSMKMFFIKKFDELNLTYPTKKIFPMLLRRKKFLCIEMKLTKILIFKHHNWEKFSLIPALKSLVMCFILIGRIFLRKKTSIKIKSTKC